MFCMKQPDSIGMGTKMDVVKYRLNVANYVKPGIFPHDLGRKIVKAEEFDMQVIMIHFI